MIEKGSIQEGKVTGIMNFGAFVALPGGKSGLIHISEIASTFVKDVHDHLQVGQIVRVKVLDINEQGKINLSLKQVVENTEAEKKDAEASAYASTAGFTRPRSPEMGEVAGPSGDPSFEEKLKKFMQDSDSKNADRRRNTERKQHYRRR
ncbi:MAG: S1 RNA-binding domain-containing protein [Candidatus Limivicinus sp.]